MFVLNLYGVQTFYKGAMLGATLKIVTLKNAGHPTLIFLVNFARIVTSLLHFSPIISFGFLIYITTVSGHFVVTQEICSNVFDSLS